MVFGGNILGGSEFMIGQRTAMKDKITGGTYPSGLGGEGGAYPIVLPPK